MIENLNNKMWVENIRADLADLDNKCSKLDEMLRKDKPDYVEQLQWDLMKKQYDVMTTYRLILAERIEYA